VWRRGPSLRGRRPRVVRGWTDRKDEEDTISGQAPTQSLNGGRPSDLASPVASYLDRLHARYAGLADGGVATYIPELAKADPQWFGICLATIDGAVYETGDTRLPFTIQSISKPLTYGLVLEDRGEEAVQSRIGVEPTGDAFNSISLAPTGTPLNAMVNSGAITAVSLVAEHAGSSPFERILDTFSRYAARPLTVDEAVYRSESATGHRNRAIAHLLRNAAVLNDDPEPVLQRYFRQCAVLVSCRDLGVIAATLANDGVNPITGERAAGAATVRRVLSVMTSCGMYDSAGEWLYAVGIPAKSGVSGGVLAVLPGRLGVAVFSPPLDARGNSIRGVRVCEDLSRDLGLHLMQPGGRAAPPIRSRHNLAQLSSKRRRTERQRSVLRTVGARAAVFELQGELSFTAAESVIRAVVSDFDRRELLLLDLRRVGRVGDPAVPALVDLCRVFVEAGGRVALSSAGLHANLTGALEQELSDGSIWLFADLDRALEWSEDELLLAAGAELGPSSFALRDHELLRGLAASQITALQPVLERRRFEHGEQVVRNGDRADALFLITRGHLSVSRELPDGGSRRLATVSAGMTLGELAIAGRGTRTADVWADTPVECYVLTADAFDELGRTDPALKCVLLENLLRIASRHARHTNEELVQIASA
jgi:glutaminase